MRGMSARAPLRGGAGHRGGDRRILANRPPGRRGASSTTERRVDADRSPLEDGTRGLEPLLRLALFRGVEPQPHIELQNVTCTVGGSMPGVIEIAP